MNPPPTTLGPNSVAFSSIARTSTSVTPRCSIRHPAWLVKERSPFHHSGNVGESACRSVVHRRTPGAGVTVANAAELRQVVDVLRTQYGLQGVAWTDPVLEVGVTPIKAIHLAELRTALDAVHVAAARTPPTYAVPALTT
jgi:hypothetical protein